MTIGYKIRLENKGSIPEFFSHHRNITDDQRKSLGTKDFIIVKSLKRNKLCDILWYFRTPHISALENGAKVIIENRFEGHSYKEVDFYNDIYHTIDKHKLDGKQFFYLSSNLKEENGHNEFMSSNPQYANNKINIVVVNELNNVILNFPYQINDADITIVPKKSFYCFNHRPAAHRLLLLQKLYHNNNLDKIYASCFQPDKDTFDGFVSDYFGSSQIPKLESFYKKLPLILDYAFSSNGENTLYSTVPLEIFRNSAAALVTETLHKDFNNTSLFYSEKTFKPMWYGLPTLIAGQKDANRYLKDNLGFELYDEIFDYTFDSVEDMPTRMQLVADQVDYINKINFYKFKPLLKEKILHNRNVLEKNKFNKTQSQYFYELLMT